MIAAEIDGAGFISQTISVTIPLLRSTILYNTVTLIIGVFQWFAEPLIIQKAAPVTQRCSTHYIYIRTPSAAKMGLCLCDGLDTAFDITRNYSCTV